MRKGEVKVSHQHPPLRSKTRRGKRWHKAYGTWKRVRGNASNLVVCGVGVARGDAGGGGARGLSQIFGRRGSADTLARHCTNRIRVETREKEERSKPSYSLIRPYINLSKREGRSTRRNLSVSGGTSAWRHRCRSTRRESSFFQEFEGEDLEPGMRKEKDSIYLFGCRPLTR